MKEREKERERKKERNFCEDKGQSFKTKQHQKQCIMALLGSHTWLYKMLESRNGTKISDKKCHSRKSKYLKYKK